MVVRILKMHTEFRIAGNSDEYEISHSINAAAMFAGTRALFSSRVGQPLNEFVW